MFIGEPSGWLLSWKILWPRHRRSEFRKDIPRYHPPGAVGLTHPYGSSQENPDQLDDDRTAHGLSGSGKGGAWEYGNQRGNPALVSKIRISSMLTMDSAAGRRRPFTQSRLTDLAESLRLRRWQWVWALLLFLL